MLRSNSQKLTTESENFIRQWIIYIIEECSYDSFSISSTYTRIVDYYSEYKNIKYIKLNLTRTHILNFD